MTGTGGLRRLTKDFVLNYPVSLPPLDEQRKIVNQTEEEIAIVEQNKRLIEIFEKKIGDKISEVWGEKQWAHDHPNFSLIRVKLKKL